MSSPASPPPPAPSPSPSSAPASAGADAPALAGLAPGRAGPLQRTALAAVWLAAAWPFGLWLVQRSDPVLAVAIARYAANVLIYAVLALGGGGALACLVFPPAAAWVRRSAARTWLGLTADTAPVQKARSELRHFETAARHAELGRLLRLRRQFDEAQPHLARAVALDPSIAGAWHQLGLVHFARAQWQAAAAAFARAEQLDPGHAFGDAMLYRGRTLHELGDAGALALLLDHERRHGGGPRGHVWRADALLRAGRGDEAREALRQAAAPPRQRLSAEDNWFRALARVRLWGRGGRGGGA